MLLVLLLLVSINPSFFNFTFVDFFPSSLSSSSVVSSSSSCHYYYYDYDYSSSVPLFAFHSLSSSFPLAASP